MKNSKSTAVSVTRPQAPVATAARPRDGAINEADKNAAEAPYAATALPLGRKINVCLRSATGDAFFTRRLGARQSRYRCRDRWGLGLTVGTLTLTRKHSRAKIELDIDRFREPSDHHAVRRLAITWFGHSTFLITTPGEKRLLFDPWLTHNPSCPERLKKPPQVDLILASHGHADHIEDLVLCARVSGAPVIGTYELCDWLERKGIQHTAPMNKGGSLTLSGLVVSMTDARHSSGFVDGGQMVYMGEASGFVIRLEDERTIYFAGDTDLFGDMRLIGEMYQPEIAFLPIGDRFTMGPKGAARACALLGVKQVVPMHWGTFPLLTGTPAALKALVEPMGVHVLELKPGETAD